MRGSLLAPAGTHVLPQTADRMAVARHRGTGGKVSSRPDGQHLVTLHTTRRCACSRDAHQRPAAATDVLRLLVASACAAAGVTALLMAHHLRKSLPLGMAFAVSAGALAAAALADRDPRFDTYAPHTAGSVLAATATAYVFLRTTGIPLMVPHPEPLDLLGAATTAAELRAASAAVPPNSRKV